MLAKAPVAARMPTRAIRKASVLVPRAPIRSVRMAASSEGSDGTSESMKQLQEASDKAVAWAQKTWDNTADKEKPAAIALVIGSVVAQIAIGATIDAVDKIPFIREFLELMGIAVTGVFAYRYITDPDEREAIKKSVDNFVDSVAGK